MINLELTDEIKKLKNDLNNLAKSLLRPIARKYDEAEHAYPEEMDVLRAAPKQRQPKADRDKNKKNKGAKKEGLGKNLQTVIAIEELCWGDTGLLLSWPGQGLGNAAIDAVATEEQLERFGDKWAAMAITEPEAGSDTASITTTAELDGEEWVLNGEKIFVTAAERSEAVVVWATIDKEAGRGGIKSFVVEKGSPGFKLDHLEKKLGIRASDTGTFVLNNCRIPKDNILGSSEVKKSKTTAGFKGVMKTFDNTRPHVAAQGLGIARAALEFTKEKLEEVGAEFDYRKSPNNIKSREKDYYLMEANLEAARLLTWRAAWMADNGKRNSMEASMAKAKAGRAGTLLTQKCCDLLGPVGFSCRDLAEKWMRDAKIIDIFEGTGQIQHLIVARQFLGLSSKELK
ncbi:MAG: acyl-CoA dehydrogenase family protein [Deltaproteobacteria bacterium]|nr:acyl-CoA dehydrogenase family protein [Deltaproteobacteria bacterium]MBW2677029.1 acyl-CoA dehydrogenase family protein [Deltaproteobacteria bacterium]